MSTEHTVVHRVKTAVPVRDKSVEIGTFARVAPAKRHEKRRDPPLNILGCFALIHAVRSLNSSERFER
jgi:hypothetical protein